MRKILSQGAAIAALTIANVTPVATAQSLGIAEINVDNVEVEMNDRASINAEQSNSGGVNRIGIAQVVIAPTAAGLIEINVDDVQATMNGQSSINADQENSAGWNAICSGQVAIC